ncbi:unnamed protein product [Effrenium voratum]|uniref:Sulfhydryl oxidase n=1 Tax=Effrenium voratum TaxID=2562239 RepID=A0AA36MXB3_9DINO|nr:unnamed protein product [Effrenium voratum]CAJ1415218.1 unnamed protein product [Effrenium voratum]
MVLDLWGLGHEAAGWLAHLPLAGKLSCLHGVKMGSVATSALGRGMDAPLAAKLAASKIGAGAAGTCAGAPSAWGPPMWKSLHCMAHGMPDTLAPEQQRSFEEMMNSLPKVLPCSSCGDHLRQHLQDDPVAPHLGTRDDLEHWLVRLHNTVNSDTGKAPVPEAEAMAGIQKMCACDNAQETLPTAATATMASMQPLAFLRPCLGREKSQVAVARPESWRDFV